MCALQKAKSYMHFQWELTHICLFFYVPTTGGGRTSPVNIHRKTYFNHTANSNTNNDHNSNNLSNNSTNQPLKNIFRQKVFSYQGYLNSKLDAQIRKIETDKILQESSCNPSSARCATIDINTNHLIKDNNIHSRTFSSPYIKNRNLDFKGTSKDQISSNWRVKEEETDIANGRTNFAETKNHFWKPRETVSSAPVAQKYWGPEYSSAVRSILNDLTKNNKTAREIINTDDYNLYRYHPQKMVFFRP